MVSKLRLGLVVVTLIPQAILYFVAQESVLAVNPQFHKIQAVSVAVSFVLALILPGPLVHWLFHKHFVRMRQLCERVKQGNYQEFLNLPNEARDGVGEDGVIILMRNMNWMAHQILVRERELQRAIIDLSASQKQVNEQNQYLTTANQQLLEAQQRLEKQANELESNYKRMQLMAMTDPLTRIANRRCFFETLAKKVTLPPCNMIPVSLLVLDIDYFKSINDNYGHQTGDYVIQKIAEIIQQHIRSTDLAARIGGEEYAVLLGDTDSHGAEKVAYKVKYAIETYSFKLQTGQSLQVTVSIGACTVTELPCYYDVEKLYGFADQALYFSKNNGRNCISFYLTENGRIAKIS